MYLIYAYLKEHLLPAYKEMLTNKSAVLLMTTTKKLLKL